MTQQHACMKLHILSANRGVVGFEQSLEHSVCTNYFSAYPRTERQTTVDEPKGRKISRLRHILLPNIL